MGEGNLQLNNSFTAITQRPEGQEGRKCFESHQDGSFKAEIEGLSA